MGRKPMGDRVMTVVERQRRHRRRALAERQLADEALSFVRGFEPFAPMNYDDLMKLRDIQRRLKALEGS